MKLIKIGRSSACDIVLQSENVSSLHAEITIIDSGEIYVCDKNSTNGTFVAGKLIKPNQEVQVRRGDLVQFGDCDLNWSRIPKPENLDNYKKVINIGTNWRNDIHLSSEFGSRFHAMVKVDQKNNILITDLGSKNGVKVNGLRVSANKDVKIKRNDIVICADEDITTELWALVGGGHSLLIKIGWIAACAAILVGICLLINHFTKEDPGPNSDPFHSVCCELLKSPSEEMSPAVVLITTQYYYVVEVKNNPIPGWSGELVFNKSPQQCSGTGFFIDSYGNIATNRHVVLPWEYDKDDFEQYIRKQIEKWPNGITTEQAYKAFQRTDLGTLIDQATETVSQMNTVIRQIYNGNYSVTGRPLAYYVAYSGRNYNSWSQMDICTFIGESGTINEDVAIIQRDVKKTPEEIKYFDIQKIRTDKLVPLSDKLFTIGYPRGFSRGLDFETHSLKPVVHTVECSKDPSRYEFEAQGAAVGGQSGSPVFDQWGHLVGLVNKTSLDNDNTLWAVKAEYLKNLYDREANK